MTEMTLHKCGCLGQGEDVGRESELRRRKVETGKEKTVTRAAWRAKFGDMELRCFG